MAISIFAPQTSKVQKGMAGKSILLYGGNSTGKTFNCVKADRTLLVAFEQGINAISGVSFVAPRKWSEWISIVRELTDEKTSVEAHKLYDTVVVDSIEPMFDLASDYVCASYGVPAVDRDADGKKSRGGIWKEYRKEISKWNAKLLLAGYTVVFIAHETTRDMVDDRGAQYTKIYPRGDKASVDFLCDNCDFIAYARNQAPGEDGREILSTLYFKPTLAFHARSRFTEMVPSIPEWNLQKVSAAIDAAIAAEEKKTGIKGETYAEKKAREDKVEKEEEKARIPLEALIDAIGSKVLAVIQVDGNKNAYEDILEETIGNRSFRVQEATEKQRELLEQILQALTERGY